MSSAPSSPLRTRLWRRLLRTRSFDGAMRRRAGELFELGQVGKHLVPGGRYLDIGGGAGHMVERLLSQPGQKLRAAGLDREWNASAHVIRRLAKNGAGRVEFGLADATRLPMADHELDGVLLSSEPHFYRSGPAWVELFAGNGFECVRQHAFDEMPPRLPGNKVPHHAFVFRAQ